MPDQNLCFKLFLPSFSITMEPKSKFLGRRGGSVWRQQRNTDTTPSSSLHTPRTRQSFSFWEKGAPRTSSASKQQQSSLFPYYTSAAIGVQQDRKKKKTSLGLQFPSPSTQPVQAPSWTAGILWGSEELNLEEKKEEEPKVQLVFNVWWLEACGKEDEPWPPVCRVITSINNKPVH